MSKTPPEAAAEPKPAGTPPAMAAGGAPALAPPLTRPGAEGLLAAVLEPRTMILLVLLSAGAILATAHALEAFAGLKPCALCLRQRIPYWAAIAAASAALLARRTVLRGATQGVLDRAALAGLAAVFAVSAGLAVQHIGVEEGWWTAGCTRSAGGTVTDLMAGIGAQSLAKCDEKVVLLFGLSMAAYNLLASVGLSAAALTALAKSFMRRPS